VQTFHEYPAHYPTLCLHQEKRIMSNYLSHIQEIHAKQWRIWRGVSSIADIVVVDEDEGDSDWLILWYQTDDYPWNLINFKIIPPTEITL
jgi:hypothetical protein